VSISSAWVSRERCTTGISAVHARVSALELGKYRVRVNSVNPTVIMTPMSAWYWGRPEIAEPFLAAMPLGRWATEDEIAAPIIFLLSDGASMITGVSLPIDGGFTCR
jgi:L-xylulose reductase